MEEIELSYPNKEFKIEEIWIDLSKQSIWKIKEIKIKTIQIPWNFEIPDPNTRLIYWYKLLHLFLNSFL